ncbi:DUF6098 family protein [Streptomyces sp. NPDC021100]|uniref:DUF6098 family protein n=1 Tax=Streptomyces sp. NPDC021100 TaxID=3365114 RepID=UPI0037A8B5F1
MTAPDALPVLTSLDDLVAMVERGKNLFVRWSRGPGKDLGPASSTDDLTGISMPGLSVNALDVEPWWDDRPLRLWVARRLYDYCHLRRDKGPGVRPWVLDGREIGRGPDNEPLVRDVRPLAWIGSGVIDEAEREVVRQRGPWGPLRRSADGEPAG